MISGLATVNCELHMLQGRTRNKLHVDNEEIFGHIYFFLLLFCIKYLKYMDTNLYVITRFFTVQIAITRGITRYLHAWQGTPQHWHQEELY